MSHERVLRPGHGDIVIARPSTSVLSFTVREMGGAIEFSAPSRDEALRLARSRAQRHGVDLWYCEERRCLLLECYRPLPLVGERQVPAQVA